MVAIAGVLAMQPALLVLDEPSAELDAAARERLIVLLQRLTLTRIFATHDLALAECVASRVVVLGQGRLAADGATASVLAQLGLMQRLGPLGAEDHSARKAGARQVQIDAGLLTRDVSYHSITHHAYHHRHRCTHPG